VVGCGAGELRKALWFPSLEAAAPIFHGGHFPPGVEHVLVTDEKGNVDCVVVNPHSPYYGKIEVNRSVADMEGDGASNFNSRNFVYPVDDPVDPLTGKPLLSVTDAATQSVWTKDMAIVGITSDGDWGSLLNATPDQDTAVLLSNPDIDPEQKVLALIALGEHQHPAVHMTHDQALKLAQLLNFMEQNFHTSFVDSAGNPRSLDAVLQEGSEKSVEAVRAAKPY
jgi:hypothetical protein